MSEPTPQDNAAIGKQILDRYQELTGDEDYETALLDLLADLMHFARLREEEDDLSFNDCLSQAERHFREEVAEAHERSATP